MTVDEVWFGTAPAKLNLELRVVGRRADGYHLLETLFHAIELHDDLWLRPAPGAAVALRVTADEPSLAVAPGADNLVVRALEALRAAFGRRDGLEVHLHKRIPAGGGLGGGSSDAATALRLGAALLGVDPAAAALHDLARQLGADVPFFLAGGSQWGRGVGDELTPCRVPPRHFVLVLPPFGCATAEVYKMFAAGWNGSAAAASVPGSTVSGMADASERMAFHNDLLLAAERVQPTLGPLRRRVADLTGAAVGMTGSGSTLFVACDDAAAARRCREALAPLEDSGAKLLVTRSAGAAAVVARRSAAQWPAGGGWG